MAYRSAAPRTTVRGIATNHASREVWPGISERGSKASYLYVTSVEAATSTVQNGAVEFHTSGAKVPDFARPDRLTLDLDPGPAVPWKTVVEAARLLRPCTAGRNGLNAARLRRAGGTDLRRRFTVRSVPARLATQRADPWAAYWTTRQAITKKMRDALAAVRLPNPAHSH